MKLRFLVIYGRWDGRRGCWHESVIRRRTLHGAMQLAERRANLHHREMSWSWSGTHRSVVHIEDAKTGVVEFDHPGFRVPSVGELGWTP